MQLRQETGNKKHIFFEDVYVDDLDFNHSDLIYYELTNSAVITVLNLYNHKILAVKICDLNSYKIDAWFNLQFKSKTQILGSPNGFLPPNYTDIQSHLIDYPLIENRASVNSHHPSAWLLYHKFFSQTAQSPLLIIDYFDNKIGFMLFDSGNLQLAHFETLATDDEFLYFLFNTLKVNECDLPLLEIKVGVNFTEQFANLFHLLEAYFENVQVLKSGIESETYPLLKEKLFLIDCLLNENNTRAL